MSRNNRLSNWQVRSVMGLLVAFVVMLLVGLSVPLAKADTSNDLVAGLAKNRYYVTDEVKNRLNTDANFKSKNSNLEQDVRNSVDKLKGKKDVRIAVISNNIIPAQYNRNTESYGNFLYGFLSNPKPDALVLVNSDSSVVSLFAESLNTAERQTITDESRTVFASNGLAAGANFVAEKAADKISGNATGGLISTIAIIAVVVLAIVGAVTFLLITTKRRWTEKVKGLEQLANTVSDQVVRVSDAVNFLPEATKVQTDADFGTATQNFSEANTRLRELQGVSPVTLLLKGPDLQRKLDLTGAQFEQTRQALTRVEQQVRSLPGL